MNILHRLRLRVGRGFLAATGAVLLFSAAAAQQVLRDTALESIRLEELQEKVVYLASPAMKGRGNGSPELRQAAEYIARSFERQGLRKAGNSHFQSFEMFTPRLGPANELAVNGAVFSMGRDFAPHYLSPSGRVRGNLVFLGYGVSAPHLNLDETAGIDLNGKIAVVVDRGPRASQTGSSFTRIHSSDFSSISTKARNIRQKGAIGLIVIQDPTGFNYPIPELVETFSPGYSPRRFVPMGNAATPSNPPIPVVITSWEAGARIVSGIGSLKQRIDDSLKPVSRDLGISATLAVDVQRLSFGTQNVVGIIEGSDPKLREEALVIGAHYDHDGESEGQIWPGADDNASGTAALMELAEAFGNGRPAPRRSIVLVAFAGEEKGQIGSDHFVNQLPSPNIRTIAMMQLDMIGRNEEHPASRRQGLERETSAGNANSVNVIGSTFSPDLRRQIEEANRGVGLQLRFRYDDTPENLLQRSDQWPFLKKGIPALFIHTGEHPDYHQPSDTPDKINYPKLEKITRLVYSTVERIANAPSRPRFIQP